MHIDWCGTGRWCMKAATLNNMHATRIFLPQILVVVRPPNSACMCSRVKPTSTNWIGEQLHGVLAKSLSRSSIGLARTLFARTVSMCSLLFGES